MPSPLPQACPFAACVMTHRWAGKDTPSRDSSQSSTSTPTSAPSPSCPADGPPPASVTPERRRVPRAASLCEPVWTEPGPSSAGTTPGQSPASSPAGQAAPQRAAGTVTNAFCRVRTLPRRFTLVVVLAVLLLLQPVMCKPWYEETPTQVKFRSRICRPLSPEDLQRLMGPAFDCSRMAADMAAAKRTFGEGFDLDSVGNPGGYQGDDPRASLVLDSADLVQEEKELSSNEVWLDETEEAEIFADERFTSESGGIEEEEEVEEEVDEEVVERKDLITRRKVFRHESDQGPGSWYSKSRSRGQDAVDGAEPTKRTVFSDAYEYMRRRRSLRNPKGRGRGRSRSRKKNNFNSNVNNPHRYDRHFEDGGQGSRGSDRDDDDDNGDDNVDATDQGARSVASPAKRKSKDSILPLRLILSGKKLRRQLKKKFRQKAKNLSKPPPWQCNMTHKIVFMMEGVFPRVLRDGRCSTDKCFYRLYNCEPAKYAIKLLQRDPDHCNPLPTTGNSTEYEERWNIITHHVTVGCNCASVSGGRRSKAKSGRRRN